MAAVQEVVRISIDYIIRQVVNFVSPYPYSNTVSDIWDTEQGALYFEVSRYDYISYMKAA